MSQLPKNLQLVFSAIIVLTMAIIYGAQPSIILPYIFGFEVQDLELKNIFRAIMGMYIAFGSYWIFGILNKEHWKSSTTVNVLFMGGLVAGRLASVILDGWSPLYGIGMIGEAILMFWALWNLKFYKELS